MSIQKWLYLKDEEGIPLEDAYLHLYLTGTKTPATIFSDSVGTSLDQSTWTTGTSGFFNFYIGNEWDILGYNASQFFDLAWSLAPFDYLADGDMESNPTVNWTAYNATLAEETTIVRSGSKSLKVIDTGSTAGAYQLFTTEIGVQYRVTGYTYIPSTLGVNASNIFAGRYPAGSEYGGAQVTVEDSWKVATFDFTATTTTTYINLNCQGPADDGTEYCFYDDISVERITPVTRSGMIEGIQLFPFLYSVDETDTGDYKTKLLSNQLAYKFELHEGQDYQDEPHDVETVNTNYEDAKNNKVVSNSLINEINSFLDILISAGAGAIEPDVDKHKVCTVLLDTFIPSAGGYYTDLWLTSSMRSSNYPIVQFYEYLSDGYKDRPPILGSPSGGSNKIISPVAIQDISPSALRVYTVNDNWLMATVVASGYKKDEI